MSDFDAREKNDIASVFGHIFLNNGPISKFQKLPDSWGLALSQYGTFGIFLRRGSLRGIHYECKANIIVMVMYLCYLIKQSLELDGNPWECNWKLCWALEPPWVDLLTRKMDMICDGPAELNGQSVLPILTLIGCQSERKWGFMWQVGHILIQ